MNDAFKTQYNYFFGAYHNRKLRVPARLSKFIIEAKVTTGRSIVPFWSYSCVMNYLVDVIWGYIFSFVAEKAILSQPNETPIYLYYRPGILSCINY